MSYLTVKNEGIGEFEEKKSVFISHVKSVKSEDEAKEYLNYIKSKNKEARHNVYAYIIGENMGTQRYSDDGEPQGTGGMILLNVLKNNGVTDAIVVVTRYFGGVLLGTGGLSRAYSKGASLAIKDANIVEKVKGIRINVIIDYDLLGKVQYVFQQKLWYIENIEYTDKIELQFYTESQKKDEVCNNIIEITSANCKINCEKEEYFLKLNDRLYKFN